MSAPDPTPAVCPVTGLPLLPCPKHEPPPLDFRPPAPASPAQVQVGDPSLWARPSPDSPEEIARRGQAIKDTNEAAAWGYPIWRGERHWPGLGG